MEYVEHTSEFSIGGFRGKATDDSEEFTGESTEYWRPKEKVITKRFSQLTTNVAEVANVNTKGYEEQSDGFLDNGTGGVTTEDWGEYTDPSTASWLTGKELTTEGYDDFTAKVTVDVDRITTEYPEHTDEFTGDGFGGETTDESFEYTDGSTECWWPRLKVTTERFSELTDNVADVSNVNTKRYPEQTEGFSDDGIGGGITEDWGAFTYASTEYRLPREELTTVGHDDFTAKVTVDVDRITTEYPEHTAEFSGDGFGGETTDDSGVFSDESTESWLPRIELTTDSFKELTGNVTNVGNVNSTEHPENTKEFSDGGFGRGSKDDWGETTEASTEY
ncbi:unnamed protein product [Dicrocoelium dendriticum]|nr:unnamed protein product [Dicrocoelium dendriticum]